MGGLIGLCVGLWLVSALGLALALTVEPNAINMCVGVGIGAVVATCMTIGEALDR